MMKKIVPLLLTTLLFADHPIPKTGLTTSVRTGDDGSLQKGIAPSYTVNNTDNTVTDNNFRLMWQNVDIWDGAKTYSVANTYCNDLTFAGYSDWRLPTRRELSTIIDYRKAFTYPIRSELYNTVSTYFPHWTSTIDPANSAQVYTIEFDKGTIGLKDKTDIGAFRCVRTY